MKPSARHSAGSEGLLGHPPTRDSSPRTAFALSTDLWLAAVEHNGTSESDSSSSSSSSSSSAAAEPVSQQASRALPTARTFQPTRIIPQQSPKQSFQNNAVKVSMDSGPYQPKRTVTKDEYQPVATHQVKPTSSRRERPYQAATTGWSVWAQQQEAARATPSPEPETQLVEPTRVKPLYSTTRSGRVSPPPYSPPRRREDDSISSLGDPDEFNPDMNLLSHEESSRHDSDPDAEAPYLMGTPYQKSRRERQDGEADEGQHKSSSKRRKQELPASVEADREDSCCTTFRIGRWKLWTRRRKRQQNA